MPSLADFKDLPIDWDLSPEHAVTMYLEWGNNDWHSNYPPVRSKHDISNYFVVDTWGHTPVLRLVRRNSEKAEDLISLDLPQQLKEEWNTHYPGLKGIFEPTDEVKGWIRDQMYK